MTRKPNDKPTIRDEYLESLCEFIGKRHATYLAKPRLDRITSLLRVKMW